MFLNITAVICVSIYNYFHHKNVLIPCVGFKGKKKAALEKKKLISSSLSEDFCNVSLETIKDENVSPEV